MALHVRHPVWLTSAPGNTAWAFALLYFIESLARASILTVLPLNAYALFGDKETVSLVYTIVAVVTLLASFAIPYMIRAFSRRWSYTIGALCIALSGFALATGAVSGQIAAMITRTFGAATLNVTLNLYIMDHIRKQDMVHSEPLRFGLSTLAWIAAPLVGLWLYQKFGLWAAGIIPVVGAVLLASVFWYLRMSEKGPIRPASMLPPSPFASLGRFISQPRLRLAWTIAFARSAFWVTFFIYVPILMIEGGVGSVAGGIAIACGNAMLLNNLVVTRLARRYSVRRMIAFACLGGALMVAGGGIAGTEHAVIAGAFLVVAAFFISMLDGLGPIAFMRAVRVHERPQMTTVYRTYLDASELIPPLVYVFAFMAFGFSGAFYVLAILLSGTGYLSWRHLPARL